MNCFLEAEWGHDCQSLGAVGLSFDSAGDDIWFDNEMDVFNRKFVGCVEVEILCDFSAFFFGPIGFVAVPTCNDLIFYFCG